MPAETHRNLRFQRRKLLVSKLEADFTRKPHGVALNRFVESKSRYATKISKGRIE
jgi:hypothetical protein